MRRAVQAGALLLALPPLASTEAAESAATPTFDAWFVDEAAEAGVVLVNVSGGREKWAIVESTGSGACFLDYDGDLDLDLYLVNGATLETLGPENPARNALYEYRGGSRFAEVTEAAGVGDRGWGGGCAVADYDNDGDPDLYVTNYGRNALYRNEGDRRFTEVAAEAGVDDPRWSTGAVFVDIDRDGLLDLYVANYLRFDSAVEATGPSGCSWKGAAVMCGPRGFEAQADALYRNRGDGTFEDVSVEAGIAGERLYGLGVVAGDLEGDGDQDLFVANDSQENLLWVNDGRGRFEDRALVAGVALSGDGRAQAGMGADLGDFDGDGDEDLFVTNFSDDYHTLYRNEGALLLTDVSIEAGVERSTRSSLGWGAGFFDVDNDGHPDLVVAGGHVYPQVDEADPTTSYRQRNLLLRNVGGRRFEDLSSAAGPGFAEVRASRGLAAADYDDDGDLDLVVVNENDTPSLLRNHSRGRHHWLKVRLIGRRSNRDGLGARLELEAGDRRLMREMRLGSGYYSSHDPRLHFGLGDETVVDRLVVAWPSGRRQVFEEVAADRLVTIDEAAGIVSSVVLQGSDPASRTAAAGPGVEAFGERPEPWLPTGSDRRLEPSALARIDDLAQAGTRALMGGDHETGIAAYLSALELLPSWEAAAGSADALGFGDPQRYRRFLSALHDNLGVGLMRAERLAECAAAIERALEIESRAKYLHNLGLCHFHGRRYPEAVAALERALEAAPTRPGLHYDLGRTLALAGRCTRAIDVLRRAIDELRGVDPEGERADAWYRLGGCLEVVHELEAAADAYRESLALVPGDQRALYKLQSVWRRLGRDGAAADAYALFRGRQPAEESLRALRRGGVGSPEARIALVRSLLEAALAPDAVHEARTLLVASQGSRAALLALGEASLALRPPDVEGAERAFRRALGIRPVDPRALAGLGLALLEDGRPDEAELAFRQALALRPGEPGAALGLGRLQTHRDPAAAVSILAQLASSRPEAAQVQVALAEAHLALDDAAAALDALDRTGRLYGAGETQRVRALARGSPFEARLLLERSPFLGAAERADLSKALSPSAGAAGSALRAPPGSPAARDRGSDRSFPR